MKNTEPPGLTLRLIMCTQSGQYSKVTKIAHGTSQKKWGKSAPSGKWRAQMDIRGGDLTAKFVQTDYFLCRVREFELKYQMDWGKFLAEFRTGKLPADPDVYAEYTEWAFLCDTFLKELIELESRSGEVH